MRLSTVGQLAKTLEVEPRTVQLWVQRGVVTPTFHQPGKGGRTLFESIDVLTVAVVRDLRRQGLGLADCAAAALFLRVLGIQRLQQAWTAGRTHLVAQEGRGAPRLVDAAEFQPPSESGRSDNRRAILIDVAACFAAISSALDLRDATDVQPA